MQKVLYYTPGLFILISGTVQCKYSLYINQLTYKNEIPHKTL